VWVSNGAVTHRRRVIVVRHDKSIASMDTSVRKQVYELTFSDFVASPAWEFAIDEEDIDGQDEATVRPFAFGDTIDCYDGSLVVAAEFVLADGTRLPGYLTPRSRDDQSLGTLQPQIVTQNGQVMFWCGRCPPPLEHAYKLLGRGPDSVFPIRFSTKVSLAQGGISGEISGFLSLNDDFKTVTIVR
jgi:hypothetical protein